MWSEHWTLTKQRLVFVRIKKKHELFFSDSYVSPEDFSAKFEAIQQSCCNLFLSFHAFFFFFRVLVPHGQQRKLTNKKNCVYFLFLLFRGNSFSWHPLLTAISLSLLQGLMVFAFTAIFTFSLFVRVTIAAPCKPLERFCRIISSWHPEKTGEKRFYWTGRFALTGFLSKTTPKNASLPCGACT